MVIQRIARRVVDNLVIGLKDLGDRVADMVDSELVTFYQMVFYSLVAINGVYTVFFVKLDQLGAPQSALLDTLPIWGYFLFFAISIAAPAYTIMGKWMRGKLAKAGAIFELVGDVGFCGLCWVYLVATYYTSYWGRGLFPSVFVLAAGICSGLFIFRDTRRLGEKDRWVEIS